MVWFNSDYDVVKKLLCMFIKVFNLVYVLN